MNGIVNPICPETKCICNCKPCECVELGQSCDYDAICLEGYCPACPKTFEEALQECQAELKKTE